MLLRKARHVRVSLAKDFTVHADKQFFDVAYTGMTKMTLEFTKLTRKD